MARLALPSLLKFIVLAALGTLATFAASEFLFRRIPDLRSLLRQTLRRHIRNNFIVQKERKL